MKKLLKKKVNVFGKSVPVLAIFVLGLALASAALLPYFGKITGSAVVSQGLLVDGLPYPASQTPITENFPAFTSLEQKTFMSLHNLENNAEVPADLEFARTCAGATTGDCDGNITTEYAKWNTPTNVLTGGSRPSVIYDGDHYEMWYWDSGIKMANSTDGDSWTDVGPAAGVSGDAFFVTKEGDTYYMINYGSPTTFDIYNSSDGLAWADQGVIYTFSAGTFKKIDNPKLLKESDGTYNLYFQAKTDETTNPATIYDIFLATTTKTSLSDIADAATNDFTGQVDVLSPGASGAWDDFRVMQPMVFKEGKQYIMMYTGYNSSDTVGKIGYAVSNNGTIFVKRSVSKVGYDTALGTNSWKTSLVNADGNIVLFYQKGANIDKATLGTYATAGDSFIVPAGETQGFFIVNKFAKMLVPDTYTITTTVEPYTTD